MKEVRTRPRFRCDFCKKITGHHAMLRHERICYYNPNRQCERCFGEGRYWQSTGNPACPEIDVECTACTLVDKLKKERPELFQAKLYEKNHQ